jgi:hypothetical protein
VIYLPAGAEARVQAAVRIEAGQLEAIYIRGNPSPNRRHDLAVWLERDRRCGREWLAEERRHLAARAET